MSWRAEAESSALNKFKGEKNKTWTQNSNDLNVDETPWGYLEKGLPKKVTFISALKEKKSSICNTKFIRKIEKFIWMPKVFFSVWSSFCFS